MRPQEIDKIALYIRVAQSLRARIADGEWQAGAQLPIIKALAKEYGVALVTVRQALAILAEDGLVEGSQGRGTFVTPTARAMRDDANLRASINDPVDLAPGASIQLLGRDVCTAFPAELGPTEAPRYPEYVAVRKLHMQDGEPFALINVIVARQIYRRFPPGRDATTKMYRLLLDYGRLRLRRSKIEMTVAYADAQTALLLRCAPMAALVRIRSIRQDETGQVAFAHVSYYRGDRFIYEAEEHDVALEASTRMVFPRARRKTEG